MKVLKIEHAGKTADQAKVAIKLSSSESIGVLLKPGEFVLAENQNTASLDSQRRRGFVNVVEYDNIDSLELGKIYHLSILEKPVDKMTQAEQDATDYMNSND